LVVVEQHLHGGITLWLLSMARQFGKRILRIRLPVRLNQLIWIQRRLVTKRRLDVDGTEEVEDFGAKDDLIAGQPIAMIMDGTSSPLGNNSNVDTDRKKRSKKDGANSTSQGSAASREESVRSQWKY
jgi:hypothetical protein